MRLALLLFLTLSTGALAQEPPPPVQDEPRGAPYNTGTAGSNVSLRDFMSSRLDQVQAHLTAAIEAQRLIIDERDKQYSQRFEAQQEALNNALNAAKEAVANALQAAKEAVNKAEEAANKRFDSVNEFRQQLADQANTFMSKAEADARLKALEEDTTKNTSRLDGLAASSAGAYALWAIIAGVIVIMVAMGGLALNISNRSRNAPAK